MKKSLKLLVLLLIGIPLLSACSNKSDIKDNFCGIYINYQYCKCAFHNEYCDAIGMSSSEAKKYVYTKYNEWKKPTEEDKEYGVIEKEGKLYLKSKPGEVLSIVSEDLPDWARPLMVTVGAIVLEPSSPSTVVSGDNNILLNGIPIVRVNDTTDHGGVITEGSTKIFVNGVPAAFVGSFVSCPMVTGVVPHVGGIIKNVY